MRILDLFSGSGGCAVGYSQAGHTVVGVDVVDQPYYPFEFHRGDALGYLAAHGAEFDLVHASPPCQAHSMMTKGPLSGRPSVDTTKYEDWLPQTRQALRDSGLPHVIENVPSAPLRRDLTLCGVYFGLEVIRHRWFEIRGNYVDQPPHIRHKGHVNMHRTSKRTLHAVVVRGPYYGVYGDVGGPVKGTLEEWQRAMGIDWVPDRALLAQMIPPAYTRYIGERLAQ